MATDYHVPLLPDDTDPNTIPDGTVPVYSTATQRWVPQVVSGGATGGVTDHGLLAGLGDDDHPQYALADGTRGSFAATVHSHEISGVTGLQAALDGKATSAQGAKADTAVQPGDDADTLGSGTATAGQVLTADGAGATSWQEASGGGGGATAPSHESIILGATATLPVDRDVLTVRATEASTVAVDDAPDGTVITVHVAEGWPYITWAPGITVTGATDTSETWVVLVRSEGAWRALVSGGAEADPDTGVVDITGLTNDIEYYRWWGYSTVRRVGKTVYLSLSSVVRWPRSTPPPRPPMLTLPVGYRPVEQIQTILVRSSSRGFVSVNIGPAGDVKTWEGDVVLTNQEGLSAYLAYPTDDPWPA